MKRRVYKLLFSFVTAFAVSSGSSVAAGPPVDVNVILPLTGSGAFIGQTMNQILKVLEQQVNATNGIQGRPLHIVIYDNASNPQTDIQLAHTLIAKNVPFVIDGGPAVICHAAAPVFVNGPVYYCLSPAFYPPKNGYAFAASAASRDGMQSLLTYLRSVGWTRLAMLSATDTPGQEADDALKTLLALPENHALSVVAWEHFNPADLSVAAQVAKIKSEAPQAMFAWVTGTANGTVLRGLNDAGANIPVFQSNANELYAQMAQYKTFMPKQYYMFATQFLSYPAASPPSMRSELQGFYHTFEAAGMRPDAGASNCWDPVMILVSALRKLGPNATADQIHDYLLQLHDYNGINGTYDFRDGFQRGLTTKDVLVVRWDADKGTWFPVSQGGGVPLKDAKP
jgi:branched-chain amino acid transport system substrate-binding protein